MLLVYNIFVVVVFVFIEVIGFDVFDIFVDLYYWFDYFSKRKNLFVEYLGFCD